MIEELFKMIQQESQQEIINNPAIQNENNNSAVGLATESIFNGLQGALANGGLKDVIGLFGGKSQPNSSNPIVGGIVNSMVGGLMKKFGIDSPVATSIAASLIPGIISKMINRTNDPSDNGFDINNIIGALTGASSNNSGVQFPEHQNAPSGGNIDFGGILKSILGGGAHNGAGANGGGGLDANRDGKIGLDDLGGLISGAASNAQQNQGQQQSQGGGIFNILKGLIGG